MIERYCSLPRGHHFIETDYEDEEYNGTGTTELVLRSWPIDEDCEITLQERSTTQNLDDWETVDSDLYHVDRSSAIITALFTFRRRPHLYRVTYTAGFDTIPSDLAEAAATLAGYLAESSNAGSGASIKRKREGQREIEFHAPDSNDSLFQSLGIDEILNSYGHEPLNDAR